MVVMARSLIFFLGILPVMNDQFSDNPERMAYLLGRRSVYIALQKFLKEANDGRRDANTTG